MRGKLSRMHVTTWCAKITFGSDGTASGWIINHTRSNSTYPVNTMVTNPVSTSPSSPTQQQTNSSQPEYQYSDYYNHQDHPISTITLFECLWSHTIPWWLQINPNPPRSVSIPTIGISTRLTSSCNWMAFLFIIYQIIVMHSSVYEYSFLFFNTDARCTDA